MSKPIYVITKYYDGSINKVDESTKDAVKGAVVKIKDQIEPKFLEGISIHVASDYANLDNHSELSKQLKKEAADRSYTRGSTLDSYNREIYIQEKAFWAQKVVNIFTQGGFRADREIEFATLHEFGHQFNYYYGTSDELKLKRSELEKKYETSENFSLTNNEKDFMKVYDENNEYSDNDDFKDALYKDLQNIDTRKLSFDETYFVDEFYSAGVNKKPTKEAVINGDYSRGEVFAQLFAYLLGGNDGNKENFTEKFPQTLEVVRNYINKHCK